MSIFTKTRNALPAAGAALLLALSAMPVRAADDSAAELRLRRAEAEIRALQRQVFPTGSEGRVFTAEINPAAPGALPAAAPATTPVTDLLTRMDAVEAALARLTAQGEENANKLALLTARMDVLAPALTASPSSNSAVVLPATAATRPTAAAAAATPAAATPSASRVAAVRAVVKPQTSDAGDDEYSYGYRLFDAKFYPEAQQQLQMFLTRYPRHARVSYARNLLGRAYLEDGKSRDAATWFLQNYQAGKTGDRAPDSLLNLGEAMRRLSDTKRACIALSEFGDTYPAEAAGRLKSQYDVLRRAVTCS